MLSFFYPATSIIKSESRLEFVPPSLNFMSISSKDSSCDA